MFSYVCRAKAELGRNGMRKEEEQQQGTCFTYVLYGIDGAWGVALAWYFDRRRLTDAADFHAN